MNTFINKSTGMAFKFLEKRKFSWTQTDGSVLHVTVYAQDSAYVEPWYATLRINSYGLDVGTVTPLLADCKYSVVIEHQGQIIECERVLDTAVNISNEPI